MSTALAIFDRCGAVPYAARARIERAFLTGDRAEMEAGTKVLRQLGDSDYLERLPQRV